MGKALYIIAGLLLSAGFIYFNLSSPALNQTMVFGVTLISAVLLAPIGRITQLLSVISESLKDS
jgi:hypothetical protein